MFHIRKITNIEHTQPAKPVTVRNIQTSSSLIFVVSLSEPRYAEISSSYFVSQHVGHYVEWVLPAISEVAKAYVAIDITEIFYTFKVEVGSLVNMHLYTINVKSEPTYSNLENLVINYTNIQFAV